MSKKEELQTKVEDAKKALSAAEAELLAFESLPENHVYPDMEEAKAWIEETLRFRAEQECEGSYNCGQPEYLQEFIVDGVHWMARLLVCYNRHDKTYYYIESADLRIEPIDGNKSGAEAIAP